MFWLNGYQLHFVNKFGYCYTQITALKNKDRISLLVLLVTLDTALKIIWPSGRAVLGHLANTSDGVCRCKNENFPPAKLSGRIIFAHANSHFIIVLNYGVCVKWSIFVISKFISHIR